MDDVKSFKTCAREMLAKILASYREHYEVSYQVNFEGVELPALARMQNRRERTLLGFNLGTKGPQANEHVLFLLEESFDRDCLARVAALLERAEKEFITWEPNHAYTFLSAVIITRQVDPDAIKPLKRYKLRKNDKRNGWSMARVAVVEIDNGFYSNADGGDLANLLKRVQN